MVCCILLRRRHAPRQGPQLTAEQMVLRNAIIQSLPDESYSPETHSTNFGDQSCSICLSDYAVKDPVRTLPCKHFFHSECVANWLRVSAHFQCPVCRLSLLPDEERPPPARTGGPPAALIPAVVATALGSRPVRGDESQGTEMAVFRRPDDTAVGAESSPTAPDAEGLRFESSSNRHPHTIDAAAFGTSTASNISLLPDQDRAVS
eukprot:TRINITY_DN3303_c0_g1_i1.p1 TRINITY_DN3303_c0_g1~~TRINITY_DN3303_c0_g1_i1.p1  ORF type:complete len:205 (-),score=33.50 TRINITY_DN3303_c0_g1_i1:58-672(-)